MSFLRSLRRQKKKKIIIIIAFFPNVYYIPHRTMCYVSSWWSGWALGCSLLSWSLQQLNWKHTAIPFLPACGFPPKRIQTCKKKTVLRLHLNPKKCTKANKQINKQTKQNKRKANQTNQTNKQTLHRTDFSNTITASVR